MTERNPCSLLLYDNFLSEFVDNNQTLSTFRSLDSARWGALAMADDLHSDQRTFGISDEDELLPYTIYIVGPDGSLTRDSAL